MDCPLPHEADCVTLAHGAGGRAMARLLAEHVAPALGSAALEHDAAALDLPGPLAFTADGFVVDPLFFPGGDIGRLAVFGAVNDLVAAGARPRALSLSMILEEGLPLATLDRVLASVAGAAAEAGVRVVTGDTKVVERGRGHGVFLTTSGLGTRELASHPSRLRPGDAILVSGDVARHGLAVLSAREGLAFTAPFVSDCAPLTPLLDALAGLDLRVMRDATRGGLAAALCELAGPFDLTLGEADIPVCPGAAAACELLGLDPLHVACEGRMVVFVGPQDAARALDALRALDPTAARIGEVTEGRGRVWLGDAHGGQRLVDRPWGAPLPRIC